MTAQVGVGRLTVDMTLYPREAVAEEHILALVDALQAGVPLPPLVADEATGRIVDGVHRWHAYRRHLGPQGKVPVEWRQYPDEAACFLDAVRLNARHGRPLTAEDRARCRSYAAQFAIAPAQLAAALSITPERLRALGVLKAPPRPQATIQPAARPVQWRGEPSPAPVRPPVGAAPAPPPRRPVASTATVQALAETLLVLMEDGTLDWGDDPTVRALRRLQVAIEAGLAVERTA
jgi:hypothetical protein